MQTKQRPWWLTLIMGIAAFVIGAILLWAPAKTKVETYQLLIAFLGIYWLIGGFAEIFSMFYDHTAWGWKLFMGIVSIIAGGYILMYPIASGLALPKIFVLMLGIWGLMEGIVLLIMAFRGGGWGAGWVKAHAGEYQGDAERIALFGHSAGGHLVTMLATVLLGGGLAFVANPYLTWALVLAAILTFVTRGVERKFKASVAPPAPR